MRLTAWLPTPDDEAAPEPEDEPLALGTPDLPPPAPPLPVPPAFASDGLARWECEPLGLLVLPEAFEAEEPGLAKWECEELPPPPPPGLAMEEEELEEEGLARWETELLGLGLGDTDGVVEALDSREPSETPLCEIVG